MVDKSKMNDVERDLIDGMEEFLGDLCSGTPVPEKYTCHQVVLDLEPAVYTAAQVKATRQQLGVSQVLFAQFLGVSPKTVRAWEQGKKPSDMACRFMDEIQRSPDHWRARVRDSVQVRTST